MFCPQCGQRQLSDEVRFCPGCGFPLNVVSEVLANRGQLAWRPPEPGAGQLTPRQKGIRQGAMIMLSSLVVVPVVLFLGVAILGFHGAFVPLAGALCVMGGLLRMLYAAFLEENTPQGAAQSAQANTLPPASPNYLGAPVRGSALPPAGSTPAHAYRPPRYNTGELVPPPATSVTDHTTRLLDKRADEPPER